MNRRVKNTGTKPQPRWEPVSEVSVGFGQGSVARGTTQLYLPAAFTKMQAVVSDFTVEAFSTTNLQIRGKFTVQANGSVPSELYKNERWKHRSFDYLVQAERLSVEANGPLMVPLMQWLLNPWLKLDNIHVKVAGKEVSSYIDQSPNFVFLPNSFPPLVSDMPEWKSYCFFESKTTAVYMPLGVNAEYSFVANFFAFNPLFDFALLLPFRKVRFPSTRLVSASPLSMSYKNSVIAPARTRELPLEVRQRLSRDNSVHPIQTKAQIANPFRETGLAYGSETSVTDSEGVHLSDFSALRFKFSTGFRPDRGSYIAVIPTQSAIPARVYEAIQSLPSFAEAIVTIDIYNLTEDQVLDYEVSTEIVDYTHPHITNITMEPRGSSTLDGFDKDAIANGAKRSRMRINQMPRMKRDVFRTITTTENATLLCQIRDRKTGNTVHRETHTVVILPKDFIIWSLKDLRGELNYTLHHLIAAWITPTDPDGALDAVRSKAALYHPEKHLDGDTGDLAGNSLQVRAIFEYLSAESGIKYVNQPFYFGIQETGQRVLTAEQVLKAECGNCIDLVVLFASLMEGLGITPLIMLMPGHAFLGWGNKHKTAEMEFLECTALGVSTFEEAQQFALDNFQTHFLLRNASDPMPSAMSQMMTGTDIINLSEARSDGVRSYAI